MAIARSSAKADLPHRVRGEGDDDPALRELEAAVEDRGPQALAHLAHCGVGQADDREAR
jgi:hypothetical protein